MKCLVIFQLISGNLILNLLKEKGRKRRKNNNKYQIKKDMKISYDTIMHLLMIHC